MDRRDGKEKEEERKSLECVWAGAHTPSARGLSQPLSDVETAQRHCRGLRHGKHDTEAPSSLSGVGRAEPDLRFHVHWGAGWESVGNGVKHTQQWPCWEHAGRGAARLTGLGSAVPHPPGAQGGTGVWHIPAA